MRRSTRRKLKVYTVIRIMDMCGYYGIDLEAMLVEKAEFNKSRSYRHGGKKI